MPSLAGVKPRIANFSYPALLSGGWRTLPMEPFRPGIRVHWLERGAAGEPTVAILVYAPGASVPPHRHVGLETIVVLDGVQSDESGEYAAGTLVLNPPGTTHSVWTKDGCAVLIQWDQPVVFLGESL
jgi:anti-sigma factor ChrR (cupin superfamily)